MATLAGWNFTGKGGQANIPASEVAAGVTAATGIGSGLLAVNDLRNGLVGRKQTKKTLAEAKADNEYVSFKLTPAAGKSLTITEVKLRPVSQNQSRTFTLTANGRDITTFTASTIFLPLKTISVTGISGVTAPVEFRLYIYGNTNEWESVGIGERRTGEAGLDLEVIGDVVPVPVPVNIQPPTNLAASNITASGFTLSWTASAGAISYEVFTGTTSRGTVNHPVTSLNITGLTANTTYSVTVRARDAAGNTSALSAALSVRTGIDTQAPSVPTGLVSSNITTSGFTVSWNASTDNVGVASYEVFTGSTSRGTVNHPARTLNITGLTANTTYAVTVRARDAAGNVSAAQSAPLSVRTAQGGIIDDTYPNSRSRMGINMSSVNEYNTDQPLKDLFKTARPWNVDSNPDETPSRRLSYDANGWVASLNGEPSARAYVMLSDTPAEIYEMGQYVLLYEGSGSIAFEGAGVSQVSTAPGRIVYNVSPQPGNRWIVITAVTPGNHIRNIRLLPAIYETDYQSNPWRPYVLSHWSRFKTLRFMDWMSTNNSTQTSWSQRTTTSWYTYNDRSGVPLELIADLCNRLHTDAWICVPHQANDDYVTQMARLLRGALAPELKIYVEYSNECWNYMFTQATYCLNNGRTTYPNISNDYERHIRWYSRRCVQIYDIFEREFGGTSRLIRVLGGQQGNSWGLQVMFEHENARNKVDAFAIAPYFGHEYACNRHQNVLSWTMAQFFNDIRTSALPHAWEGVKECIDYAKSVNKPMLAYEGGQHLVGGACGNVDTGSNNTLTQRFIEANLSPEMGAVYTTDLDRWRSMGGGMYCAFATLTEYTRWGCWGILRYPKQNLAAAPKYQAILNWISNNPA